MLARLAPPPDLPAAEARIPALAVRIALVLVGGLLSLLVYGTSGWLVLGILLALLAAWQPDYLLAWVLIVFLALGQLDHRATLRWQLLALLAGVQLLHLLASLALMLPWRAWVQPAVLITPLLRLIAIQIPVQVVAVLALLLLAPNAHGHRPLTIPEFTLVGAAALAGLAVLLLRRRPDQH
jgi:hypothetical protein